MSLRRSPAPEPLIVIDRDEDPPRKRRPRWPAAVLLLAAAGTFWAVRGDGRAAAPDPAPRPRFIAAPGLVESESGLRELAFPTSGRIRAIHVDESQAVTSGQVLAELENEEAQARAAAARADLAASEAGLIVLAADVEAEEIRTRCEADRLKAELERLRAGNLPVEKERARAEARAAEIEWRIRDEDAKRYSNLRIASVQERDLTRGAADVAQANFLAADAKAREVEVGPRPEEIAKTEAELRAAEADHARVRATRAARLRAAGERVGEAKARVRLADAEVRKTQIVSPVDGRVVWKLRQVGETVGVLAPESVLGVADLSRLRVRADVDEADFSSLRPGQRVEITTGAYGARVIAGRVDRVGLAVGEKRFSTGEARERRDVKIVETLILLDDPPPLKLGLRVTAAFLLDDPPAP